MVFKDPLNRLPFEGYYFVLGSSDSLIKARVASCREALNGLRLEAS